MLHALYSIQFRGHTPVFITVLVASLCALVFLCEPMPATLAEHSAEKLANHVTTTTQRSLSGSGMVQDKSPKQTTTNASSLATRQSPLEFGSSPFVPIVTILFTFLP